MGIAAERETEANHQVTARQAYIGLGVALVAAAFEEVDATPIKGFDPAAVYDILGLRLKNLSIVVMLPLGYRAVEGDWLVALKKVRRRRRSDVAARSSSRGELKVAASPAVLGVNARPRP